MDKVSDAMKRDVVALRPDTTVEEAIGILLKHNISGAPVIDGNGQLCGIISQFRLLEVISDPDVKSDTVKDLMTREVLVVQEDDSLALASDLFIVHRVHRLPVMRNGKVVGVISRSDLLRYSSSVGETMKSFFGKLKQGTPTTLGDVVYA